MAAIRRKRFTNAQGETATQSRWLVCFRDHCGLRHEVSGFTDRAASAELGRRLEQLASCRASGMVPPPELARIVDGFPADLRDSLIRWGMIDGQQAARTTRLSEHIEAFAESLRRKGRAPSTTEKAKSNLRRLTRDCRFAFISDLNGGTVSQYIADLYDTGQQRLADYIAQTAKQFSRWAVRQGLLAVDPLIRVDRPAVEVQRIRRALTVDEQRRLLSATIGSNETVGGLEPRRRACCYGLALGCGLRRNEIVTLTAGDIDLAAGTVAIRAENEKARRVAVLPIPAWLGGLLAPVIRDALPTAQPFKQLRRAAEMLRADLQRAGIDVDTSEGVIDFHSLRGSFGTGLARAGVSVQTASKLMRHADPKLTLQKYTFLTVNDYRTATATMPDILSQPAESIAAVAGMNDADSVPAPIAATSRINADIFGQSKVVTEKVTQKSASGEFSSVYGEKSQSSDAEEWLPRRDSNPGPVIQSHVS